MAFIEKLKNRLSGVTQPVSISDTVASSGGVQTEREVIMTNDGAIVGKLQARIYVGAELDLRLEIDKERRGVRSSLVKYAGTKTYIDGDDDVHEWEVFIPIEKDDKVIVKPVNVNTAYAYDYRVNFAVDYVREQVK